jgi:hypothetical protein
VEALVEIPLGEIFGRCLIPEDVVAHWKDMCFGDAFCFYVMLLVDTSLGCTRGVARAVELLSDKIPIPNLLYTDKGLIFHEAQIDRFTACACI